LNLLDYAWSTVQFITNESPNGIKVILDESRYPYLDRDASGWVIHVSEPRVSDESFFSLNGMHFDRDPVGRTSLWRLFRASIVHLSLHTFASDFSIYDNAFERENEKNITFAKSLAEDYAIRGVMQALWKGLLLETAQANHDCHLSMKLPPPEATLATRIASSFLSYSLVGKKLVSLGGELDSQIEEAHSNLVELSKSVRQLYENGRESGSIADMKLRAARQVLQIFNGANARLASIPTIPYTEHYDQDLNSPASDDKGDESLASSSLEDAFRELSIETDDAKLNESEAALRFESDSILGSWEFNLKRSERVLEHYSRSIANSHFEWYGFPKQDLAEFIRIRTRLIGRIRCALDLLRMAKTSIAELSSQEYGFADIPLAIQVLITKSSRTDIYIREDFDEKTESWAILIDSSKSLERFVCTVKDAAVCLAEVANGMLPGSQSWACYAFNQNLNIIKDFSEPYSSEVKARIGGISTGLKTYLPDAIRLVGSRLEATHSDFKVILVISDGYPMGYEGIDQELVKAIGEANKKGMSLIGIGIESSAVAKNFRTTINASDAYELMKGFVNVYYGIVSASV
jgi:hypothetical protein